MNKSSFLPLARKSEITQKIPKINFDRLISGYLLEEPNLISDKFEEKFIENIKNGKFLLSKIEDDGGEIDQNLNEEMKRFKNLFSSNKEIEEKLKKDLHTGLYEEAFRSQAEKVGTLLKRAARKIYNQKAQILEENMEKQNRKLKKKVLEISEFMKRQENASKYHISKSKYSNISSRYYNSNASLNYNISNRGEILENILIKNDSDKKIEKSYNLQKDPSKNFDYNEKSQIFENQENSQISQKAGLISPFIQESTEKSRISQILPDRFQEKVHFILDPPRNSYPKTALNDRKIMVSKTHHSALKNRLLSPIFLTDVKGMNLSKIEQREEVSGLMSSMSPNSKCDKLLKKKSTLYEAMNEDFDRKLQKEQEMKWALKNKNKKENKELKQKLEKLLQDLDESKAFEAEEKSEFKKNIVNMHEKWEQIEDKTKGVDALRLLARDYKEAKITKPMVVITGFGLAKRK